MNLFIQRFAIKLAETWVDTLAALGSCCWLGAGDKRYHEVWHFPQRLIQYSSALWCTQREDSWTWHTLLMYCTTSWMYDRIISVFSLKMNDKEIITWTHPSSTNMGTAGFQMKVIELSTFFLLLQQREIQLVSSDRGQVLPKAQALFTAKWQEGCLTISERRWGTHGACGHLWYGAVPNGSLAG